MPLIYLGLVEPRRLKLERWRVRVDGLPPACEGLRLVLLSDFHIGMWWSTTAHMRRALRLAAAQRPDVALLAGDITHLGRWHGDRDLFTPLAAACPTFAVLGNHDHYASQRDTEAIVEALREQGVRVLVNEHAPVAVPGLPWLVVGIDDWATGNADLVRAVTGIAPHTRLLALLTHIPDVAAHVPSGWFPLILAGHTHGKRLRAGWFERIPWVRRRMRIVRTRYPRGFYEVNGALLYVTRGIGMSEVPIRGGSLPEITVMDLTGGASLPPGARYRKL